LSKIIQVTDIIKDIAIPVIIPNFIPSFDGKIKEIGFLSIFMYQIVGITNIIILHIIKKTCEDISSSNILMPNITDMEGIKPTNNIPIKADLLDSMSKLYNDHK